MSDYRTFIVPYDFSEHAKAALYAAVDLAKRLRADLHLVHVIQNPSYLYASPHGDVPPPPMNVEGLRQGTLDSLGEVAAQVRDLPGKIERHVIEGVAIADAISELAQQLKADLIVMGTHGRTGLAHVFLGSVAERTLRKAPCPVLTLKAPEDREKG